MHVAEPQPIPLQDNLIDSREVERAVDISSRTVQRLVARRLMPAPFKVGAQNRWSRRAIEAWIAQGCPAVATEEVRHGAP